MLVLSLSEIDNVDLHATHLLVYRNKKQHGETTDEAKIKLLHLVLSNLLAA